MSRPAITYDDLLSDIKRQLSRIKTELPTHQGLEMCNEVQRHLNRVMADVAESAKPFEDADYWEGTVYGKILRLKGEDYD